MRFEQLRLQNFCGHEELDITFGPGINGIVGPNGTGKSTILDALRLLVTGKSIAAGRKEENIRWGERTARLETGFIHGDSSFTVHHRIASTQTETRLRGDTIDGEITKRAEIRSFIETLLGCSTDALLRNIFIPQKRIEKIIAALPSERLREIQYTVGLQRAAEAERALANEMSRYTITPGLEASIVSLGESLSQARTRERQLVEQNCELEAEIATLTRFQDTIDRAKRACDSEASIANADARVSQARKRLEESEASLAQSEHDYAAAESLYSQLSESAPSAKTELREAESAAELIDLTNETKRRFDEVRAALTGLKPESDYRSEIEMARRTLVVLTEKRHERQAQLSGAQELPLPDLADETLRGLKQTDDALSALGTNAQLELARLDEAILRQDKELTIFRETGRCPTCGHSPENFDFATAQNALRDLRERRDESNARTSREADELRAKRDVLELELHAFKDEAREAVKTKLATIDERIGSLESVIVQLDSDAVRARDLVSQHDSLQKQLSQLPVVSEVPPERLDLLRKQVDQYDRVSLRLRELEHAKRLVGASVDRIREELTEAEESRRQLGEAVQMPPEEELTAARAGVEKLSARTHERRQLLDDLATVRVRIEHLESTLSSTQEQKAKEAADAEWVDRCARVRKVMHVSGYPSRCMREYAALMNARMQYYLDLWEASFTMRLNDDLAFEVEFPGGYVVSADRLSGGQQIVASTSFRLAMADTFARSAGFLILDEPSAYLDAANLEHLQRLLCKLKELSGSTGTQIILVTHEESLISFFDNTIEL